MDVVSGAVQLSEETSTRVRGEVRRLRGRQRDLIPPEEAEDCDGDGKSDERERVAHRVHGLHVGEVHVRA